MDPHQSLGHLTEVNITGLFGSRDFAFRLEHKEPTLLTGSNGSGKSTLLRAINAIGTGEWRTLGNLPFESIELTFAHGTHFYLRQESRLTVRLNDEPFEVSLEDLEVADYMGLPDDLVSSMLPDVVSIGPGMYELRGRYLDREDLAKYLYQRGYIRFSEELAPLAKFVDMFHLLFVTDQRLVVSDQRLDGFRHRPARVANRTAADLAARELGRQMQAALSAYASESQRRDRDFPQRVVRAMASTDEIPVTRIEGLLKEVEKDRIALQAVGLLPRDLPADPFRDLPLHDPKVRPVIETWVQDTRAKFEVLADLRDRLTLFVDFLNQHYENKRVVAQSREGFRIEIDEGNSLVPSSLSSGEQQILVLAYEVLFKSEQETLVLIDEPELSLHVLWQDSFVEDLSRMGAVRNLQFILATHSPSLIGGREDLKRSLDQVR